MLGFDAHDDVAHDVVGNSLDSVKLLGNGSLGVEVHQDVCAFAVPVHLVGQTALVPFSCCLDFSALVGD